MPNSSVVARGLNHPVHDISNTPKPRLQSGCPDSITGEAKQDLSAARRGTMVDSALAIQAELIVISAQLEDMRTSFDRRQAPDGMEMRAWIKRECGRLRRDIRMPLPTPEAYDLGRREAASLAESTASHNCDKALYSST